MLVALLLAYGCRLATRLLGIAGLSVRFLLTLWIFLAVFASAFFMFLAEYENTLPALPLTLIVVSVCICSIVWLFARNGTYLSNGKRIRWNGAMVIALLGGFLGTALLWVTVTILVIQGNL